jgi:hypothetical protein
VALRKLGQHGHDCFWLPIGEQGGQCEQVVLAIAVIRPKRDVKPPEISESTNLILCGAAIKVKKLAELLKRLSPIFPTCVNLVLNECPWIP